jgi:hypothetical protein
MIGSGEILRLAGRSDFSDKPREGLPVLELSDLCRRLADARERAGMSARAFRSLKGDTLRSFAREGLFTRAEVRLGQRLVGYVWSMWRVSKTAAHVAAVRRRRGQYNERGAIR